MDRASLPRAVETADGQCLLFREITPDDLDDVLALYRRLDPDATYRRFFTGTRPHEEFFEHLTHIAERGGCSIVAVDQDAGEGEGEIVAEADVERLANGNGEVAVTVDKRWRGWLGTYRLSLLREEAARRGIPNLEAEILTCNRPMRALTRHYGEAVLPQGDWQTVRVAFASAGAAPSWPPERLPGATGTPRVLVELRSMSVEALAELVAGGYDVLACRSRDAASPPCPMLSADAPDDCPLARGADVILVVSTDVDERQRLLEAHADHHPDVPAVAVEVRPNHGVTGKALLAAVEKGLVPKR